MQRAQIPSPASCKPAARGLGSPRRVLAEVASYPNVALTQASPHNHLTEGTPPVSRMIEAGNPIGELVTGRQWDQLRDALRPMHPSDIADVIIAQPTETERQPFRPHPRPNAARACAVRPAA